MQKGRVREGEGGGGGGVLGGRREEVQGRQGGAKID